MLGLLMILTFSSSKCKLLTMLQRCFTVNAPHMCTGVRHNACRCPSCHPSLCKVHPIKAKMYQRSMLNAIVVEAFNQIADPTGTSGLLRRQSAPAVALARCLIMCLPLTGASRASPLLLDCCCRLLLQRNCWCARPPAAEQRLLCTYRPGIRPTGLHSCTRDVRA